MATSSTQFGGTMASMGPGPAAVEMSATQGASHITVHGTAADPIMAAASAPPAFAKVDEIENHILRPNARNQLEIVERVSNKASKGMGCADILCCMTGCCGLAAFCCGRAFRTGVGQIDLWLDSDKLPVALNPNTWQCRPNFCEDRLGGYDMSSSEAFSSKGVCIAKIEAGAVYFANMRGQPVMIAAKDNPGWFVTTDPGFSFAKEIFVDGQRVYGCKAKLSSPYINFESLHLFNVQPNSVHIVSRYLPNVGSQFEVLPPGSHTFSSPFMKSISVIPTSIQDVIIVEDRVSTQDGIGLSNCKAVLSYQIRLENVRKLLDLDVQNYREVIQDWAKRTMLHEIGNTDYVSHSGPVGAASEGQSPGGTSTGSSMSSVLGSRGPSALPGAGVRSEDGDGNFRPALEHHMRKSLEHSLTPYGVQVLTFALQSFDPPAQLVSQVTIALAKRTEAQYQFQAAQIQNQTLLAAAETEAQAIQTRAAAVAKAANMTASVPHARALQVLDKQVEIARAWSNGNARTLVLQGGGGSGGGLPFASISEMADDKEQGQK